MKKGKKEFLRESKSRKVFNFCNVMLLALFAAVALFPFWYVLVLSFNEGRDAMAGGIWLWPRTFTLENFQLAFQDSRLFRSLGVSIFITGMQVLLGLVFMSLVAYAMSVPSFPGRSAFAFYWYFTTLFGGGMIPYYLLLRRLGLLDSIWLYIIPGIYSFSRFVMIRTYFQNIPGELRESAQIDGAGHFRIVFTMYIPLAKPMLATQGLMIGVSQWNNWFTGAYYQTNSKLYPAATVLKMLMSEATAQITAQELEGGGQALASSAQMVSYTSTSIQYAFVMLLTIPILVAYPFVQKYFVKGMLVGSVKG